MNLNSYQQLALRTAPPAISHNDPNDLDHAITGLFTEGGELADIRKRAKFYDASNGKVDLVHVMEEVGDVLWYCALAMRYVGQPMANAAVANIAKLQKRYPHKFDTVRALDRNLPAEREALTLDGGRAAVLAAARDILAELEEMPPTIGVDYIISRKNIDALRFALKQVMAGGPYLTGTGVEPPKTGTLTPHNP